MNTNKISFILILVFAVTTSLTANGQCSVNSTTGYSVNMNVYPEAIIAPASCANGYNYRVRMNYNVALVGASAPASLWTLQGNVTCDNKSIFYDLPNGGGSGRVNSSNDWTGRKDCSAITPETMNCNNTDVIIQGPGIAYQTISCNVILPVDLLYFNANYVDNKVEITWSTSMEKNNDYYTVQRSADGISWSDIKNIQGAGLSNYVLTYTEFDENPLSGISYYRLKQTDYDGEFEYFPIVVVNAQSSVEITVFPNPVQEQLSVKIVSSEEINQVFEILDINGKIAMSGELTFAENTIQISELPLGIYYFKTNNFSKRIVKI